MDRYIIKIDDKYYYIYPLAEFKIKDEEYIIYTNTSEIEKIENIYVGKNEKEKIVKVNDDLINDFKIIIENIINEIKENN